jgi:DDE superfamily endonuclease
VNQKQIDQLKKDQKQLRDGSAARRAMAVLLFVSKGDVSFSGYTIDHAKRLKGQYLKHGIDAFKDKRTSQRDRVLTSIERNQVIATLQTKQPKDVIGLCTDTNWSTYLLGEYIYVLTGKHYKSKTSSYLLFREARLSFHLPGKSYEKADPARAASWEKTQCHGRSTLMRAWHDPDTVILCEDEMVLTSATTLQKIWLPRNAYPPVVETNGTRKRRSFYGFYDLKTGSQHAYVTEWQNMYITVEVLQKLRKAYPDQKLLLVWDNCGWHRGSKVAEWIKQDGNTKTLYFPPYTPELNPQEHVWKAGRKATTHNLHITDIQESAEQFARYITGRKFSYELCGLRPHVSWQD